MNLDLAYRSFVLVVAGHPQVERLIKHRAILEALRRRDPEGAKRAVEAHVFRFRDLVVGRLRKGGG